MKTGDKVRIIQELESNENHKVLWDEPLDTNSTRNSWISTGKFHYSEVGIVLEQKYVSDGLPLHVQTTWIKVLCSGRIGWIKSCELELIP